MLDLHIRFKHLNIKTMKVKEELNIDVLLNYGFIKIDKEEEENKDDYSFLLHFDYKFTIGHSRRGQFYYLLVCESEREILIYASEPDGSGSSIGCPDILIKLIEEGVIQ